MVKHKRHTTTLHFKYQEHKTVASTVLPLYRNYVKNKSMQVHTHVIYKLSSGFSEDESKSAAEFHRPVDRQTALDPNLANRRKETEYQL